mmetsp:Transcript_100122/g.172846  ORF Transcript_100122/g.172846 Transcript_100122/m.172846 type:complete len:152 (-) Transcript_100122:1401-1856(-)
MAHPPAHKQHQRTSAWLLLTFGAPQRVSTTALPASVYPLVAPSAPNARTPSGDFVARTTAGTATHAYRGGLAKGGFARDQTQNWKNVARKIDESLTFVLITAGPQADLVSILWGARQLSCRMPRACATSASTTFASATLPLCSPSFSSLAF